ncbi:MAG: GH3 auxin-responsive promoter family protein [Bacteroidia bacterium]|nr:GH3 auxin-responsive promoter family protein [Bacteroidia bacterium]
MSLKRTIAEIWARLRARQIARTAREGALVQAEVLKELLHRARNTAFGREHGFAKIRTVQEFQQAVPVTDYETSKSWFDRIYKGEADVTWPGKPLYLAKTSGTTSGAKYIPITRDSIKYQVESARDALLLYIAETGKSRFLDGKMMFLSGSPVVDTNDYGIKVGRLSGIVNHFVPAYLLKNRIPTFATNSIEDWETKVDAILDEATREDLRVISGIPPWVQMFFDRLKVRFGKEPLEQWPNLQLFVQGGVDFSPYKPIFDYFWGDKVDIVEVFPASEGFFAYQDTQKEGSLLLNTDSGIFYEFIPLNEYGSANPTRLTLSEVELETQYALILSTNAGLWAYDIGDTVKFVSKNPFKLKVTGRVKHFISAFGEHVISEEVNRAMIAACGSQGGKVREFTVAPWVSEQQGESFHEWLVEFDQEPLDLTAFVQTLDTEIRKQNAYYDDLREGNMLKPLQLRVLQENACADYMRAAGKLGGQNKFPRLSNNRILANELIKRIKA